MLTDASLPMIWIGALITLAIYSFLYNDNKIYRMVLNFCIGVTVGFDFMVIMWKSTLAPLWWDKMWGGYPASHTSWWQYMISNPNASLYWLILGILGLFWYCQGSKKYMWLARIVIGIQMGANTGIIFKQQLMLNIPQIQDSCRPLLSTAPNSLWPSGQPWIGSGLPPAALSFSQSINNLIVVAGIACVMTYFFFSFEHKHNAIKGPANVGRWLLMISMGAFFGNTIMTRMAVLLQRIQFLHDDWGMTRTFGMPSWILGFGTLGIGVVIYFLITGKQPKKPSGPSSPEPEDELPSKVAPGV